MAEQSQRKNNTVWFLVHRQELMHQTIETFKNLNIPLNTIHVGMIGTALKKFPKPDFIIFDEAQHTLAKTWLKVIEAYPESFICGLTATPCRLDGKPLGQVYDILIEGISARELIDMGYLAPYKYLAPSVADLTGLKTKGSDFNREQAAEMLSGTTIYGDVIKHYRENADGLQAICYCSSVKHSQEVAKAFLSAGIKAVHFDGNTPKTEREGIIRAYRQGKIKILCNVDLISEGFDVPDCHCCILLRPTMSTTLFIQQSMRAMRPQQGKTAIILDHVGNYTRHGLPADDREWSLESRLAPRKEYSDDGKLIVTQCTVCFATYPSAPVCPYCGAKRELTKQEIKNIENIRLEEIKESKRKQARKSIANKSVSELHSLQEFQEFAKNKGYKPGWAYMQWKKTGAGRFIGR